VLTGDATPLDCKGFIDFVDGCNGMGGVFGYKYTDAKDNDGEDGDDSEDTDGQLDLWIWLPDPKEAKSDAMPLEKGSSVNMYLSERILGQKGDDDHYLEFGQTLALDSCTSLFSSQILPMLSLTSLLLLNFS